MVISSLVLAKEAERLSIVLGFTGLLFRVVASSCGILASSTMSVGQRASDLAL